MAMPLSRILFALLLFTGNPCSLGARVLSESLAMDELDETINATRISVRDRVRGHTTLGTLRVLGIQADADGKCRDVYRKVQALIDFDIAEGRSDSLEERAKGDIDASLAGGAVLDEILEVVSRSDLERQLLVGDVIDASDLNHLVECELNRTSVRLEETTSTDEGEMVEGDILLDSETEEDSGESLAQLRSDIAAGRWAGSLWSGGKVPYCFQIGLGDTSKRMFRNAVNKIMQRTCLTFEEVEAATEKKCTTTPSIMVKDNKPGCFSSLGYKMFKWNSQRLNLEQGCWVMGVVLHEIGHAIGMSHEHSRSDRDKHITINWQNIAPASYKRWFETEYFAYTGDAYDYASLMHYGAYEFSGGGGPTITDKKGATPRGMGQRSGFSEQDWAQINKMYGCR